MTKPSATTGAANVVAVRPARAQKAAAVPTEPVTMRPLPCPPRKADRAERLAGLHAATDRFLAEILGPNQADPPATGATNARRGGSSSSLHNDNVAAARNRLSRSLVNEKNVMEAARWEARVARVCLLALVPAAVVTRFVMDATWVVDATATPAGTMVGLTAAGFAAVGSRWTWLVTSPPFVFARGQTREDVARLMRLRESAQQLAVRLATGTAPAAAQHRVELLNHLSLGTLSRVSSAGEATELAEACTDQLVRHVCGPSNCVAIVTLPPFLACLLPAVGLTLVI